MDGIIATSIVVIALASTRIWRNNPRKTLGDLTDLTRSIRESGVDQPLIVRPVDPPEVVQRDGETVTITHEVIDGQRRWHAATAAGSLGVPCIVRSMTDAEALEIALRANDQREPVNALEEAEAIKLRLDDAKDPCTVEQLADRMGRDKRYILRRLSLLGLCETARGWLRAGTLPLRHAEALAVLDPATQAERCTAWKTREIPPYRAFVKDLAFALTVLNNAPFDVKDAKLVPEVGACGACPKNSTAQPDLFGGVSEDAHCCNRPCWDAKVEAHWRREQRDAKRKGLAIVEDVIAYGTTTKREAPYVSAEDLPKGHEQEPTAITRNEHGHVVTLYDRPKPAQKPAKPRAVVDTTHTGDDCDDAEDPSTDDIEPESDNRADEADVGTARRPSRLVRELATLTAVARVAATPAGAITVARVALYNAVSEWGPEDFIQVLTALGLSYEGRDFDEEVAAIPDELVGRVLVTYLSTSVLLAASDETPTFERELRAMLDAPAAPPSAEAPPASAEPMYRVLVIPDDADWLKLVKGLSGFSAEKNPGAGSSSGGSCRPLREVHTHAGHSDLGKLIDRLNKASIPYLDMGEVTRAQVFDCAPTFRQVRERWNAAHPTRPVTIGDGEPGWAPVESPPAPNGTRLWITEKVWDGLTDDLRTMLCQPDVGVEEIVWEGREGHVTAVVSDEETLKAFKSLAKEHRVKFHEGDEPPAKRSKAVKS